MPIVLSGIGGTAAVAAGNAWMNPPGGCTLRDGQATDVRPLEVFFNGAFWYEALHMLLVAYMVAGFVIAGVYAVGMLRGRRDRLHRLHRPGLAIPLTVAAVVTPLQIVVGDVAAHEVARNEPAKFAAARAGGPRHRGAGRGVRFPQGDGAHRPAAGGGGGVRRVLGGDAVLPRRRGRRHRLRPGPRGGYGDPMASWVNPTSVLGGVLAVLACACVAAVFLTAEARRREDDALEAWFRRRALVTAGVAGAAALAGIAVLRSDAPRLFDDLLGPGLPLVVVSGVRGMAALALLRRGAPRLLQVLAVAVVAAVAAGWRVAPYPYILGTHLTISAAAPEPTLWALTVVLRRRCWSSSRRWPCCSP